MAETIYHVRIRGPFVASKRVRAGITVSASDGYTGPLTKEQLEAIKADEVLTVGKPGAEDTSDSTDHESAEQVLAQANEQAGKILEDAKAEAEKVKAEAREEADKVVSDAKAEAEKVKASAKPASK